MSGKKSRFELSSNELEFLRLLSSHERALESFLPLFQAESIGKYNIDLGRPEAERLRGYLTEMLAKIGFNSDYSPNEQGRLLEGLIDRFYRP